jgi:cell division transport system permease protein
MIKEKPTMSLIEQTPDTTAVKTKSRNRRRKKQVVPEQVGFMERRRGTFIARISVALRTLLSSIAGNAPLTIAAILSAAVALTLIGAASVTSSGINNATLRWRGGVETIVFMQPDATATQIAQAQQELEGNPIVGSVRVVDQQEAYTEFQQLFAETPDLVNTVRPEALPVSFRLVPAEGTSELQLDELGVLLLEDPDVWQIVYARDAVRSVLNVSEIVQLVLTSLAVILGVVAVILTYSASRAAAYARRDELAIMRTVGAPKWLVRLPFIGEGAFAGAVGALFAVSATWLLGRVLNTRVTDGEALAILQNFSVSAEQLWITTLLIVVLGVVGGALGAAFAVGRYVRAGDAKRRRFN